MNHSPALLISLAALMGGSAAAQPAGTLGQPGCLVVKANPAPKEKAEWSGPCQDDYAHGDGKLSWFLGAVPAGVFEGRMERGLQREGYEKSADGAQYDGQFKNGLRDGVGTFVSTRDDRYTGMWKEGKRHGKGKVSYSMGGSFEGNWEEDRPAGPGKVIWAGGRITDNTVHPPLKARAEAEATSKPGYAFKDSVDPFFGRGPQRFERSYSQVPFKLSYEQLSVSQRAMVREEYPLLHEEDEPPYPLQGFQSITRSLIQAQDLRRTAGKLSARVTVGANGMPREVTVFESPEPEMVKFLTHVMLNERYKPALCAGKPCEMFLFVDYKLVLQ